MILVVDVMEEIQTVAEPEWRHPLVSVRSSLNRDTDDLCWTAEIHPYPLRMIINTRWPGCSVASSDFVSVESGKESSVVFVPWRRWSNSFVGDFSGLHSHWQMAHGSYNFAKKVLVKVHLALCFSKLFMGLDFQQGANPIDTN